MCRLITNGLIFCFNIKTYVRRTLNFVSISKPNITSDKYQYFIAISKPVKTLALDFVSISKPSKTSALQFVLYRNRCWRAGAHTHINVLILHYISLYPKYRNFFRNIVNSLRNSISQTKSGYASRFFIPQNTK
jgi:hypothetical protein